MDAAGVEYENGDNYRVGQKRGHSLITIILSISNRFKKFFFTGRFLGKLAVKCISKIPSHLAYVATLRHYLVKH